MSFSESVSRRQSDRLFNDRTKTYVDDDRNSALEFAADLASGLLEYIEKDLAERLESDRASLPTLEAALTALKKK